MVPLLNRKGDIYDPGKCNNNNFLCANILEDQAQ